MLENQFRRSGGLCVKYTSMEHFLQPHASLLLQRSFPVQSCNVLACFSNSASKHRGLFSSCILTLLISSYDLARLVKASILTGEKPRSVIALASGDGAPLRRRMGALSLGVWLSEPLFGVACCCFWFMLALSYKCLEAEARATDNSSDNVKDTESRLITLIW